MNEFKMGDPFRERAWERAVVGIPPNEDSHPLGFLPKDAKSTGYLRGSYQLLTILGRPPDGLRAAYHSISYPQYGSPLSMHATFRTVMRLNP